MNRTVKKFADPGEVAGHFASDFADWTSSHSSDHFHVALSGGSTPRLLFQIWAKEYADKVDWSRIHFFWGDERCVPPDDPESNYGVAKELFFEKVAAAASNAVPESNVHRILGEANPEQERRRYEDEIARILPSTAIGFPQFDLIILGMGDDGHTASIFPHQSEFLRSEKVCEIATHPVSGQKRITLTGPVINNASRVACLVTGANKAGVLKQVIEQVGDFEQYPMSHIQPNELYFYVDQPAASKLSDH